jgi:hypothetical protein
MTKTHFGFQTIDEHEKESRVRGVFDNVASRYDVMNDVMSGGLHRLWKREMVATLAPRAGQKILDVAGGTGDIAFRILSTLSPWERGGASLCEGSDKHISPHPNLLPEGEGIPAPRQDTAEEIPLASCPILSYTASPSPWWRGNSQIIVGSFAVRNAHPVSLTGMHAMIKA